MVFYRLDVHSLREEDPTLYQRAPSIYRAAFQCTVVVVGTLLALWLLYEIRQLVVSIAVALVFAAAISPFVGRLEARRVPRGAAIMVAYVGIIAVAFAILFVAVPPLARESADLAAQLISSAKRLESWVDSLQKLLGQGGGSGLEIDKALSQALQASSSLVPGIFRITFSLASGVLSLLLVLAISFYWLVERDDVERTVIRLVAAKHRERFLLLWREIEMKLGAYVRGQLLDALAVGILTLIGLSLLGVEFALPLAIIAGVTGLVPIVGATLGGIPAVLIGFSQSPEKALLVLGLYLIVQQVEGNFLAPKIMQQSVGISPLTVLIAIVIGGSLLGVIGAMLAIPSAAAVQVLTVRLLLDRADPLAAEEGMAATEATP
jgi:predicted PurR-regulated permease PerM